MTKSKGPTFEKRRRERKLQEKRQEKAERRWEKRDEKALKDVAGGGAPSADLDRRPDEDDPRAVSQPLD